MSIITIIVTTLYVYTLKGLGSNQPMSLVKPTL